jgi:ribosome-associated heat shock protein Hsp15
MAQPGSPAETAPRSEGEAVQRLDKWLWHARFVKSRSLAAKLVESGKIRVNRQKAAKASVCVRCGDVLTATIQDRVRVIEIVALANRRGPASEAQRLYRERPLSREASLPPDAPL